MTTEKLKLNGTKLGTSIAKASETNVEIPQKIQIVTATANFSPIYCNIVINIHIMSCFKKTCK